MRAKWQALREGARTSVTWDWPDGTNATLSALAGPDGRVEIVNALLRKDGRA